jgi:diaminopimelate decarboxylase
MISPHFFKEIPTPFYHYSNKILSGTVDFAAKASAKYGYHIHYALKANNHPEILKFMIDAGFGADCVSGNEVLAALKAGFIPEKIAFAGVGKTDAEILIGLKNQIFSFNVESIPELEVIDEIASLHKLNANIALRINPNVDANTHKYITTGMEENKFGLNIWDIPKVIEILNQSEFLKIKGLHFHIGSQITDFNVFKQLCLKANKVQDYFSQEQILIEHINMGGGLGINYHNPESEIIPDFDAYFSVFNQFLELKPNQELHFELGRSLVAQCGSLITKVLYIKEGAARKFAIVDAGMTELMRPALYQSFHSIDVLEPQSDIFMKYDVVGPICESTDVFRKSVDLPQIKRGDFLAIRSVGAYGQVMSSGYNMRNIIASVFE